ncbi:MAG: radical SAM protein [Thiobacillus sp. 63-78]|uniref:radical SAM protein n=1 Tax=Thiobacillus sp. 63-78 TaxID=1895859 RepID=UPI0009618C98|nr:radical SAM protein [Thiobacillus sp. 63-78]MBN8762015.1 radical SAM protein [Thiobacillus sp.]OJZ09904.1 MAG: radical SAM protein [Thiobacillus sp. 63-78]
MDLTVVSTFRCNSKCQMCYIWKNPTEPKEEVSLETLSKLPGGFDNLNVSGGEPTLRKDLAELADLLHPKARIMEISSNGLHPERLVPIIKKYPDIKVRFSLEGDELTSNRIRGEKDGYATKVAGLRMLQEAGGTDLGFAFVIQDENVDQLVRTYELAKSMGFELATSTLHNAWQFYKNDNYFYDRVNVARQVEGLVTALLKSGKIKNWFRAYLNLGLIEKILGHPRLIPCTAGTDFAFIDPWSDVWACNVRSDLPMGNLARQSWEEILASGTTRDSVGKVAACEQNCWMVTTARTAMRSSIIPQAPKLGPMFWVLKNKLKLSLGKPICFDDYIDYSHVKPTPHIQRINYLENKEKVKLVKGRDTVDARYPLKQFENV